MQLITKNKLKDNYYSSGDANFQFVITKKDLEFSFCKHTTYDRLYLFHTCTRIIDINNKNNYRLQEFSFERKFYTKEKHATSDNFVPIFFLVLHVFYFLFLAVDILEKKKVITLLKEAEDFDPTYSCIFFLQFAYRLSYAILGRNYLEERGKKSIEEIKQRCIIEDYWNSFCEIYPRSSPFEGPHFSYVLAKTLYIGKKENIIIPCMHKRFWPIIDNILEKDKCRENQSFMHVSKKYNDNTILFTYLADLQVDEKNTYHICDYENYLVLPGFLNSSLIEARFGRRNIPVIPKILAPLLIKALLAFQEMLFLDKVNYETVFSKINYLRDYLEESSEFIKLVVERVNILRTGHAIFEKIKENADIEKTIKDLVKDIIHSYNYSLDAYNYLCFLVTLEDMQRKFLRDILPVVSDSYEDTLHLKYYLEIGEPSAGIYKDLSRNKNLRQMLHNIITSNTDEILAILENKGKYS